MRYIQLLVVLLAIYLFARFVITVLGLTWKMFRSPSAGRSDRRSPGPDEVDAIPVVDLSGFGYTRRIGKDRFGRMVYEVPDGHRGNLYVYFDRTASEAERLRKASTSTSETANDASRLSLAWKGFDADSSPWDVLGVARDASVGQIKAAYRKLIGKYHPDRFSTLSRPEIEQLENDSKLVNAAYAKLVKST